MASLERKSEEMEHQHLIVDEDGIVIYDPDDDAIDDSDCYEWNGQRYYKGERYELDYNIPEERAVIERLDALAAAKEKQQRLISWLVPAACVVIVAGIALLFYHIYGII